MASLLIDVSLLAGLVAVCCSILAGYLLARGRPLQSRRLLPTAAVTYALCIVCAWPIGIAIAVSMALSIAVGLAIRHIYKN